MEIYWKVWVLGGFTRDQYIVGLAKKGELEQFADVRGGLAKKTEWCNWGRVDTPMHTMPKKKWVAYKKMSSWISR